MTAMSIPQRNARQVQRDAATHLLAIGQMVRLKSGFGRPAAAADVFQIIARLPTNGTSVQYRIRNEEERHERVTTQDNLEPVALPESEEIPTGPDSDA